MSLGTGAFTGQQGACTLQAQQGGIHGNPFADHSHSELILADLWLLLSLFVAYFSLNRCGFLLSHIKKLTSLFPSDFKSVFVWHLTGKILTFEFYPKAVFFEWQFRFSRSAIAHVQKNWPIVLQRAGSRIKWRQRLTTLKLQRVNAAYFTRKTRVSKSESSKLLCCILI